MKTVCKQVYSKYPQFDLSHKKDFIKSTVKSVSTLFYTYLSNTSVYFEECTIYFKNVILNIKIHIPPAFVVIFLKLRFQKL